MMLKTYYVYIITNYKRTTLYVGFTGNLERRIDQHRNSHYEGFADVNEAIAREKHIKKWRRAWKERLINELNPEWRDLSEGWYD